MNVLILDTETTHLFPDHGEICEIAAILYSIRFGILNQISLLLPVDTNPAEHINKIKAQSTKQMDYSLTILGLKLIENMVMDSDYIIAHNAEFDKKWCESKLNFKQLDVRWICTLHDFVWPDDKKNNKSLISLAISYGVPVVSAHRALTDCELIAKIFDKERENENLGNLIKDAIIPRSAYQAVINYYDRDKAKDAGFNWDPDLKIWKKRLTENEAKKIGFKLQKIK